MRKTLFLLALLLACGAGYAALNYHFIIMESSVKILKKTELTLEDTFVDARGMKRFKLYLKPSLVKAGIKNFFTDERIKLEK